VGRGEHGDILLATSAREQIVKEYRDDLDPQVRNPDVLAEMSTLIIDLSSPAAPAVIATMENFRGIKTMILLGGDSGAPVDLPAILRKAAGYPLEELYVINFQHFVTALPPEVGQFRKLRLLAAFNNAITALPPQIAACGQLETLYVDVNPIRTVLPAVRSLPRLGTLGIGKTGISAGERADLHRLLPACSILTE
jgi:Leucine-rich repeat (LRR) protein